MSAEAIRRPLWRPMEMEKAGSGPRRECWRRIRTVLLAPPVVLIVVLTLLFIIGVFVAVSAGSHALRLHANGELMAFILGLLIAGFLELYWVISRHALRRGRLDHRGQSGNMDSTESLSRLSAAEWHHFSNVPFCEGGFGNASWEVDVDHVVVGPYGVLVVESKYCSSPVDLGSTRLDGTELEMQSNKPATTRGEFMPYCNEMRPVQSLSQRAPCKSSEQEAFLIPWTPGRSDRRSADAPASRGRWSTREISIAPRFRQGDCRPRPGDGA